MLGHGAGGLLGRKVNWRGLECVARRKGPDKKEDPFTSESLPAPSSQYHQKLPEEEAVHPDPLSGEAWRSSFFSRTSSPLYYNPL